LRTYLWFQHRQVAQECYLRRMASRKRIHLTPLLLVLPYTLFACGDEEPETRNDEESANADGDGNGDGDTGATPIDAGAGMASCGNALDCPEEGQVCNKEEGARVGVCAQCAGDIDCDKGHTCAAGACRTVCETDEECGGDSPVCDTASGLCVSCLTAEDCSEGEFCAEGFCSSTLCVPGVRSCVGDSVISECNDDGTGFLTPTACEEGTCAETTDGAVCETGGGGTGGGTSGGSGGSGSGGMTGGGGTNLITNGDFASGASGWEGGGGPPDTSSGAGCVGANMHAPRTVGWQGSGSGITLQPGSYSFSYTLTTTGSAMVEAKVSPVNYPYEPVLFSQTVTSSQSHTFSVSSALENVGLAFNVSGDDGVQVCIDDVSLTLN